MVDQKLINEVIEKKIELYLKKNPRAKTWGDEVWEREKEMIWVETLFNGYKSKNFSNIKARMEEMKKLGFEIDISRLERWRSKGWVEINTFGHGLVEEFWDLWKKNPFPTRTVHLEKCCSSKAGLVFKLEKL